jgi:hypothetical protein
MVMTDAIETFLADYPENIQVISRKLRVMVRAAMPQANEILLSSQNHFAYSLTETQGGSIVYICPMKDYVRLGFYRGTQLPDPDQKLVGEGKWLRHIKVRTLQESDHAALEPLVKAAWDDADKNMRKKKPK